MKNVLAVIGAIVVLAFLIASCGNTTATDDGSAPHRGEGTPVVYDRMDSETCGELQAEFDQAMENYDRMGRQQSLDYAKYANTVMEDRC